MADVILRPAFQSPYADTGDATRFGPAAWNAARLFSGGAPGQLIARDPFSPTGASWVTPAAGAAWGTLSGLLSAQADLVAALAGKSDLVAGVVAPAQGGTGLAAYAAGDLLVATAPGVLARLAVGAAGTVLVGGAAPAWSASPTFAGIPTIGVNGIAAVDTDGLILQNATPATAAIPVQQAPRVRFRSQVWNTTATAASNTDDWWFEGVPTSGATPSSTFKIGKSLNGGTVTYPLTISSNGLLIVRDGIFGANGNWGISAGGAFTLPAAGTFNIATRYAIASGIDGTLGLSNSGNTLGVGLDFSVDAVLKIRTRSQAAYAALDALGYRVGGVAGVSFGPAAVTSITIVNGIVTAIA